MPMEAAFGISWYVIMPKIGYDFRAVASKQKSGVETYITQVVAQVPGNMPEATFYLFIDNNSKTSDWKGYAAKNIKIIKIPFTKEVLFWNAVKLLVPILGIDLFHFPLGIMPVRLRCKTIINIHDLTYEFHPEFYQEWEVELQRTKVPDAAKNCDEVLTISESTKRDVHTKYGIKESKIRVIYPPFLEARGASTGAPGGVHQGKDYFLAIGNVQPRKNFTRIVEALAHLPKSTKLYIVGKPQDEAELRRIDRLLSKLSLKSRVRITGYVSDEELANLYDGAVALVFTSIYEGFGYPIVEAFSRGVPVITSRGSSMEEVAGPGAIIVDQNSPESIASAMDTLLVSEKKRQELISKGNQRLKQLTKTNFGEEIAKEYRGVLNA